MCIEKVIIVRHGDYDDRHRLSPSGEKQMKRIADLIRPHLTPNSIFLSSSAPRGEDSAKVLSAELNLKFRTFPELHSGNDSSDSQNNNRALLLIWDEAKKNRADCAIVVTHLEYAEELPSEFIPGSYPDIKKGEGLIIDLNASRSLKISGR